MLTAPRLLPLVTALLALGLAACGPAETPPQQTAAPTPAQPATPPATDAAATTEAHDFSPAIMADDFAAHVQTLASDAFEGRAPGSKGEQLTVEYLTDHFKRLGLKPGNGDSWVQTVPMVATTADPSTTVTLTVGDDSETLPFGSDMVIGTRSGQTEVKVEDSELVFVGYGVNAPEANWNDYEGLDVKGKTVVILVNDPGFHVGDEELFGGKRMTYYGRWSYKYEEAARQGAAAALVVHDDEGAGYPWAVVENSWGGAQFDLPASEDPDPRLPLQGWLSGAAAERLFAKSGKDFMALREAANRPDFEPVDLGGTFSATVKSSIREGKSDNVMALLPGSEAPDEVVVYMAHWDHLGRTFQATGDGIYNGAIDNATGVAGVLEIAEKFVNEAPPKRSVLFLMVTLEESGLLGSKFYVAQPSIPLHKTVAAINLDAMTVAGQARDMTVIGLGSSELEDILKPIAESQQRALHAETAVHAGYYYRSDHFNFAKAGVPALYAKSGYDHVEKGEAFGQQIADDYTTNRYHKPADEFDPNWDLTGVMQDLDALYRVGRELTDSDRWPNWYEGNEFRAAREASLAAAGEQAPGGDAD